MVDKKKAGIGIMALLVAIAGGSYAFDFSQTTTIISDDDVTNILTNLNLDLDVDDLKELCAGEAIPEKYQGACDALVLLTGGG